jgi:hypothetical protein
VRSGPILSADEDQKSAAVQKIAESAPFRRSPRIRELLLHIAEYTIAGRQEELSETRIGERVFGRDNYHSSEDNIVRVSARQLRVKLSEYYETDGRQDEVILEVPKGGYRAVFHTRESPPQAPPAPLPPVSIAVEPSRDSRLVIRVLAAICLALIVIVVILWKENSALRAQKLPSSIPTLFSPVSHAGSQRTNIILTDSALILWQALIHKSVSLEDYAGGRYFDADSDSVLKNLPLNFFPTLRSRQITSLADMRILSQIFQSQPAEAHGIFLHHARNLHVRDFDNDDNFVIIGSARSNPWAALFEKNLKFTTDSTYGSNCFNNRHVLAGESAQYCPQDPVNEQGTDFGRLAVLRNGNHKGRVVLIAGTLMESTEATGEFFLNPESILPLEKVFHVSRPADLPDYEVLLETHSVGGAGRSPKIINARTVTDVH